MRLVDLLGNGEALRKFRDWIAAQGGDLSYVDDATKLPQANLVQEVPAPHTGYVAGLDARAVGLTSMLLGGGRAAKGDKIDHAVGVVLQVKVGDRVEQGQPLMIIHANDSAKLSGARNNLLAAIEWSDEPVSPPDLIHQIVS